MRDEVFHDFEVRIVGIAAVAAEHGFDEDHVALAQVAHLRVGGLVVVDGRNIEDILQPEARVLPLDFNDGGIGGHIAEPLAFTRCFNEQRADEPCGKDRVDDVQHRAQYYVAPFGVLAIEAHYFGAHGHLAGRLPGASYFEKNEVEEKQQEIEQYDKDAPMRIEYFPAEQGADQLKQHEIPQRNQQQIEQIPEDPLAQQGQFVLYGHVLGGGYFYGLLHLVMSEE